MGKNKISDTSNHTHATHNTEDSTAKIVSISVHDDPSTETSAISGFSGISSGSNNPCITNDDHENIYNQNGNLKKKKIKKIENKNEDSSKRLVKTLTILVIMY